MSPFLSVFVGRHLQDPAGESCIVLVVVATKQVAHAKVVDDVRGGSSCVLQYGFVRHQIVDQLQF